MCPHAPRERALLRPCLQAWSCGASPSCGAEARVAMLAQAPVWDEDSLCADESLDEPARKRPALLGANNVPVRLLQLAAELQVINSENDGTAVSRMQALPLATMTGQIREIEQRALQLARDEGREEFRTKALLNNLHVRIAHYCSLVGRRAVRARAAQWIAAAVEDSARGGA